MINSPHEDRVLKKLQQLVANTNAEVGAKVLFIDWKELPVLSPHELDELAKTKRGWYSASEAYETLHQREIPSQGHAIRLGRQLLASGRPVRQRGAQRLYWIAPPGVRPMEQIGVS